MVDPRFTKATCNNNNDDDVVDQDEDTRETLQHSFDEKVVAICFYYSNGFDVADGNIHDRGDEGESFMDLGWMQFDKVFAGMNTGTLVSRGLGGTTGRMGLATTYASHEVDIRVACYKFLATKSCLGLACYFAKNAP